MVEISRATVIQYIQLAFNELTKEGPASVDNVKHAKSYLAEALRIARAVEAYEAKDD